MGGPGSKTMLKERLAIAQKVAQEVHEAEAAIDMAIAKLGVLVTSLPEAQAAAKLSSVAGDTAFGHLQAAIGGMFNGRAGLVALHNELASMKDKVGLRHIVVGFGDAGKLLPPSGHLAESDAVAGSRDPEAKAA
ncbi:MAG TPA: hypothetical protein PKD99_02085 [Sphingopyxis sp.]|nr:hypothetical protein [Sphingopyxis sp.]HMP43867.1 hypothetical protein [Sphingopyxis sp.]